MQFHTPPVFSARLGPIYLIGVLAMLALGHAEPGRNGQPYAVA